MGERSSKPQILNLSGQMTTLQQKAGKLSTITVSLVCALPLQKKKKKSSSLLEFLRARLSSNPQLDSYSMPLQSLLSYFNAISANILMFSPIRHGGINLTPALPARKESAGHAWAAELVKLHLQQLHIPVFVL